MLLEFVLSLIFFRFVFFVFTTPSSLPIRPLMPHKTKLKPALPDLSGSVTRSGTLFGAPPIVVNSSNASPILVPLESTKSVPIIRINSLPLSNRGNPLASLLADLSSPHGAASHMPVFPSVTGEHSLSPLLASVGKTAWQQSVVGLGDGKSFVMSILYKMNVGMGWLLMPLLAATFMYLSMAQ